MHTESIEQWMHDHTFGQDRKKSGERKTLIVVAITLLMMIIEILTGVVFGSMALLSDGLHMGSHASALAISLFAYYYTRRHAEDARFNFGTGKVNSLAAFASSIILVFFALVMAWESIQRFISPVTIRFNQAILVAVIGLIVNGVCLFILGGYSSSHERKDHRHHDHSHTTSDHVHDYKNDQNLWSAYLHVLADALTSFLAIFALLSGKYLGLIWLDPLMGLVGAALVINWSRNLIISSSRVLLDIQSPKKIREEIRHAIESESDNRVSDLHFWSVGPGIYSAEITVVSSQPLDVNDYYKLLPKDIALAHVTIEIRKCSSPALSEN